MYNRAETAPVGMLKRGSMESLGNACAPHDVSPEIPASMQNLEKEVEALIEVSKVLTGRINGILRPEMPRPETNSKDAPDPMKSPVAEHADRIAIRVRRHHQDLGDVIDRLGL